jgi:diaminohydroxyphosphoribosylaminopyrimidine deaminase/5-amino-6-(5-phosphoribosylamino)uracil reductase
MYVTLEPCAHWGQTPPCTDAIIAAGVRRVVCATRDPNPQARGGAARLRQAGIRVDVGIEAEAARELNAAFFAAHERPGVPWVVLKLAVSSDGAVARKGGGRTQITGLRADREVHRLRAAVDAIAVGRGTAVADDPLLTVRYGRPPRVPPVRVVFARSARLPVHLRLVRGARDTPTVVVVATPDPRRERALVHAGVEVIRARSVRRALQLLARQGVQSLLVEGGPRLARAFLRARAVDRIVIFRSPRRLGAGALAAFDDASLLDRCRVISRRRIGRDVVTVYDPRTLRS